MFNAHSHRTFESLLIYLNLMSQNGNGAFWAMNEQRAIPTFLCIHHHVVSPKTVQCLLIVFQPRFESLWSRRTTVLPNGADEHPFWNCGWGLSRFQLYSCGRMERHSLKLNNFLIYSYYFYEKIRNFSRNYSTSLMRSFVIRSNF